MGVALPLPVQFTEIVIAVVAALIVSYVPKTIVDGAFMVQLKAATAGGAASAAAPAASAATAARQIACRCARSGWLRCLMV
ncbi:hypothetical protein WG70_18140 [Burkholderia oklahomensis EO147]|nr:hypothetical protein WG70_18140 [Burkholderia oklahomensis EO147]AOI45195.1 hypothetical protein WI23_04895 [Burkholderia oklahomensis C6786]KUY59498.1 hypothetical protein WI23_15680 [Burkholderia oklahomensis C6786]KUY69206.1 hypothetical protein WG70_23270 [Burkholderia oklahomensis EO147]